MVIETYQELFTTCAGILRDPSKTPEQIMEAFKATVEETGLATKLMKLVDAALQRNGGGKFLVGNDLTIADFAMCAMIHNIFWNDMAEWSAMYKAWLAQNFPRVEEYGKALGVAQAKHLKARHQARF